MIMNILSGDMIMKSINESTKIVSLKSSLKFPDELQSIHGILFRVREKVIICLR